MGIFHGEIRDVNEKERRTLFSISPFGGLDEAFEDLNFEDLFKGNKKRRSRLNDLSILVSFGFSSIPHELIHAGVNVLTGGSNKEIVINRFYGGDLAHAVYPGIQSRFLAPIFGGYVEPREYGSELGKVAMVASPYVLTPLGIYLLEEGKRRNSPSLAIAGSGIIVGHAGSCIGDFATLGRTLSYSAVNVPVRALGAKSFHVEEYLSASLPLWITGLYLGCQMTSTSYKLFKRGVDYCRNIFRRNPGKNT